MLFGGVTKTLEPYFSVLFSRCLPLSKLLATLSPCSQGQQHGLEVKENWPFFSSNHNFESINPNLWISLPDQVSLSK